MVEKQLRPAAFRKLPVPVQMPYGVCFSGADHKMEPVEDIDLAGSGIEIKK